MFPSPFPQIHRRESYDRHRAPEVNRRVGTATPLLSPRAWSVVGVLTVNVAPFDHHERDSDRDHWDRNACGYPSTD